MPLTIGGPGTDSFDPALTIPSSRRLWGISDASNPHAAFTSQMLDAAGVGRAVLTLNGGPQMRIVGRQRVGRLGFSAAEVATDQTAHNGGAVGTYFWPAVAQQSAVNSALAQHLRCYSFRATIALLTGAINWGNITGILFRWARLGVGWWAPEVGANVDRAGFGLCGDGAGGWAWKSKVDDGGVAQPFAEVIPLVWPVSVTDFLTVTFVVFSATASKPMKVQLWLANTLAVERQWNADGSSIVLPMCEPTPDLASGLVFQLGGAGASNGGNALFIRDMELQMGAVHPITNEVLKGT